VRPSSPDKPTTLARLAPGEKLAARNLVLEFHTRHPEAVRV
jgi:hypothetical protein